MEEIKAVFNQNNISPNEKALLDMVTNKAKKDGVQVGVVWDKSVYDYLFENNKADIDLNDLFGFEIYPTDEIVDLL